MALLIISPLGTEDVARRLRPNLCSAAGKRFKPSHELFVVSSSRGPQRHNDDLALRLLLAEAVQLVYTYPLSQI